MKQIIVIFLLIMEPLFIYSQTYNKILDFKESTALSLNKILKDTSAERIDALNQKNINRIVSPFKVNYSYKNPLGKLFGQYSIENSWLSVNDSGRLSAIVIYGLGDRAINDSLVQKFGNAKFRGGVTTAPLRKDAYTYYFWDNSSEGLILYFTNYSLIHSTDQVNQPFLIIIHNKNPDEYLMHNIKK